MQSEIRPFRGLLLGFFFISVGLSLDSAALLQAWPAVLVVTAGLIVAKAALNMGASLIFRWSIPGSTQLALLLAQGSEFAFVIFSLGSVHAMVGARTTAVLVAAVALSLALTPGLAELGRSLAGQLRRRRARVDTDRELLSREALPPVVIVGMGRRGRAVADALTELEISYSAIERDPQRPERGGRGRLPGRVRRQHRSAALERRGARVASCRRADRALARDRGRAHARGADFAPAPKKASGRGRQQHRRGVCRSGFSAGR